MRQREAVGDSRIAADPADKDRVLAGRLERIGHFADHHAGGRVQQFGQYRRRQ